MNLIDVGIVAIVGLGLFIGWSRGLVGPLMGSGGFLLVYWLMASQPAAVAPLLPAGVPPPVALFGLPLAMGFGLALIGRVMGAVFRLPLTRTLDRVLGAAATGCLAFGIAYAMLLGLASAGEVLGPIDRAARIGSPQVAAMQTLLSQYPQAGALVSTSELGQLAAATATHPVPVDQLGQYAQIIDYYERDLRPQLASSRLAPRVLRLGANLPLIGQRVPPPLR